jgi:hypothetical protein
MKKPVILLACGLLLLGGCRQPVASDLTFYRGAQLLASGSPQSAIPFLSQTIASTPDGPEPVAMLALAYALDLQPERAIGQARQVRRAAGAAPGWEFVAVGIAEMTRHQPAQAVMVLRKGLDQLPADSPIAASARQWLALSQIFKQEHDAAGETLRVLAKSPNMQSGAMLWLSLVHAFGGQSALVSEDLTQCAAAISSVAGRQALKSNLAGADDQTLYDAAVAAVAQGDFDTAQGFFTTVQQHSADGCDAGVWLALLAAARPQTDFQTPRNLLKEACQSGSLQSRGLANQLFSVVCALEDRPEDMVQCMLAGQRMMGRNSMTQRTVDQPKPESVWFSDNIK